MLKPLDSLEILAIVDNEVDPMSPAPPVVSATGRLGEVALLEGKSIGEKLGGGTVKELAMEHVAALMTATHSSTPQTLLFDTGPTPSIFISNTSGLSAPLHRVSHIHLSHWHRDHSGGLLSAIQLINQVTSPTHASPVTVDLHPNRPAYRGFATKHGVLALEPDPTSEEVDAMGAKVLKAAELHEVLDIYFLISGEIPRVTEYEHGIQRGVRWEDGEWKSDFVFCHLKDKGLVLCNVFLRILKVYIL